MVRIAFPLVLFAACTSETTSFRTTDRGDGIDREGPPAAAYDVRIEDRLVANVHVWSNGGYISNTELPMTHIGFEIENKQGTELGFDGDMLELVVYETGGAPLPATNFTVVAPLGPALVVIPPRTTQRFDAYFELRVRPRVVESMRVRWALRSGDAKYTGLTHFVRDDDQPSVDYRPPREPR